MNNKIDFSALSARLLMRSRELLMEWLPGGKIHGQEYCVGSINGGKGESLKINIVKGVWCDFATGDKGGDLIDLYAAVNRLSLAEAANSLNERFGTVSFTSPPEPVRAAPELTLAPPPEGTPPPDFTHRFHGTPAIVYSYNENGRFAFYVARYEPVGAKKQMIPFSWDTISKRWVNKAWEVRPLYFSVSPEGRESEPVLITEGEKAADAAGFLCGEKYVVATWMGGTNAYKKTDWTPLYGKRILLWPDADAEGVRAMQAIAELLRPHCPEIKIIDVEGMPDKWDAADFTGFDYKEWFQWAKPRVSIYTPPPEPVVQEPEVIQADPDPEADIPFPTPEELEELDALAENPSGDVAFTIRQMQALCQLATNDKGTPFCNLQNAVRVLENFHPFQDLVWLDEFHNKIFTMKNVPTGHRPREWNDRDTLVFKHFLQAKVGLSRISTGDAFDAIVFFAQSRPRNEPREYMEGLKWDGVPRVSMFLPNYFWAEDTEFNLAIGKNLWVSVAARTFRPGCKVDNMVILEGSQGTFKSTALSVLFDPWFAEATEAVATKDFCLQIQGRLVVEIAELDAFNKAEANTIKKVISQQVDRFRPPYGKLTQDFPRTCIFVGSTNDDEYLKDPTGARRFWPVKVRRADIEQLKIDREQLFAEAVHLYKSGETWWEVPESEAINEQADRTEKDEWQERIEKFCIGKLEVKIAEVWEDCLKMHIGELSMLMQKRVGKCLRVAGYDKRNMRRAGVVMKLWIKNLDRPAPEDTKFSVN